MIITGIDNIREAQTIPYPTSADVYCALPGKTGGYAHAFYNIERGAWTYGWHETREDAAAFYDEFKSMCAMAPDMLNWMAYSEMVIWAANGTDPRSHQTRWALNGIVVED